MSKFASTLINGITPYVAGEQPRDKYYIKLNTNENPYFASKFAAQAIDGAVLQNLNRYSDPENIRLRGAIAEYYGMDLANVLVTNGSDEALAFAFYAYCGDGVCYPDVTYGFYDVIAGLFKCPVEHINLRADFTVDYERFYNKGKTVVLANPNAQTGIELGLEQLESIVAQNADNIVIIDQAYADFGSFNAVELTKKYKNLVVVNTFSKSRSLAGARVGYVIADASLIEDLSKVKNSFHPYNVNSLSALLAESAIRDKEYFGFTVGAIKRTRHLLAEGLTSLGFEYLPSSANFILAKYGTIGGQRLYEELKERGVLVRHFNDEKIADYVRITVGTDGETATLLSVLASIVAENKLK